MDWRNFCKKLLLLDGRLDAAESDRVRRAVLADRVVDADEVEFLLELRRDARAVDPGFNTFLYEVVRQIVLKDGVVNVAETAWLRRMIFDRGLLAGPQERAFLSGIARDACQVAPAFHALLADCGGPLP